MSSLSRGYYWGYRHLHSVWSLTFRRLVFLLCCLCSSLDFELPLGFNWNPDKESRFIVEKVSASSHHLCGAEAHKGGNKTSLKKNTKLLTLDIHAFGHDKTIITKKNPYLHYLLNETLNTSTLSGFARATAPTPLRTYFHETAFHSMYLNQYKKE